MKLDLIPLSELEPSPRNPKGHDLGGIHTSMDRFGWQGAIIVDGRRIVAGHGRTEVLNQKKAQGDPPPLGIEVSKSGDWLVPALQGRFNSEGELEAYLVADNRWVELGGWEAADLLEILTDLAPDLEGTGFTLEDLNELALPYEDGFPQDYDDDFDPADTNVVVGSYRFQITRDEFHAWRDKVRMDVGFADEDVQKAIRERLGL